jgi:hypothetical protein
MLVIFFIVFFLSINLSMIILLIKWQKKIKLLTISFSMTMYHSHDFISKLFSYKIWTGNKTQLMWRFGSADELVDIELRFEWHFGAVTWWIDATPPMPHSERPHVSITQKMLLEDNLQVFPFSFFLRPKKENSKSKDKSNVSVMEMLLLSSSRSRERY